MKTVLKEFVEAIYDDGYTGGGWLIEDVYCDEQITKLLRILGFTREHVELLREAHLDWDGPYEWVKDTEDSLFSLADLIEDLLPPTEETSNGPHDSRRGRTWQDPSQGV